MHDEDRERSRPPLAADAAALDLALTRLPRHHSKETVTGWRAMAAAGEIGALAEALIVAHYDPAYRRAGGGREAAAVLCIDALDDPALSAAADQIAARLSAG